MTLYIRDRTPAADAWVVGVTYFPDPDIAVKVDYTVLNNQSDVIQAPNEMNHNALSMEIEGLLYAAPVPIELFLKTDFDLETGTVVVSEQGGRR